MAWISFLDRKADYAATTVWQKMLSSLLQEDRTLSISWQINDEINSVGQTWFWLADMYNKKEMRDSHGHSAANTLSAEYENAYCKAQHQDARFQKSYLEGHEHLHCDPRIYLKNLLLENEAALKQQQQQKHSNKLTFQEFQASTNIQSSKSKQLYLKNWL